MVRVSNLQKKIYTTKISTQSDLIYKKKKIGFYKGTKIGFYTNKIRFYTIYILHKST